MIEMSFKYNLLQSVAISHRTEHESYDEDHGHDGVLAWVVLPPWRGSDVVAMKMILVTTLMLLVIMMMMRW